MTRTRHAESPLVPAFATDIERCIGTSDDHVIVCSGGRCEADAVQVWSTDCVDEVGLDDRPFGALYDSSPTSWGKNALREQSRDSDTLTFHVGLEVPSFDFRRFQREDTSSLVDERKAAIEPYQALVEQIVEHELRGTVMSRTWLAPGLVVSIPSSNLGALLTIPGVVDVNPGGSGKNHDAWDGSHVTTGTLSEQLSVAGYQGEDNGRRGGSSNLRIGISEEGATFNCTHVGWKDTLHGASRVIDTDFCDNTGCSGSTCGSTNTHATRVAWTAAGSIEQGQDLGFPGTNTLSQRRRSGVAQEAEVFVYQWDEDVAGGECSLQKSIEAALADGVDVLNISWGGGKCHTSRNDCSANQAIANASRAGMLTVASSGNSSPVWGEAGCSVEYPAVRTEVVSVGALASNNESTSYENLVAANNYSWGTKWMYTYSGSPHSAWAPMVDLLAPWQLDHYFASGTIGYSTVDVAGTSYSAPIVAGIAALTREWMNDIGFSGNTTGALIANLLAQGDNFAGSAIPSAQNTTQVGSQTGFGRIRAHFPQTASTGGNGTFWGSWSRTITQSNHTYIALPKNPQPTAINGIHIALTHFDDYTVRPHVQLRVVDLCSSGGEEVVRTASPQLFRQSISLTSATDIHGRCLYLKITGIDVPPGGESVYVAAYSYSNSPILH